MRRSARIFRLACVLLLVLLVQGPAALAQRVDSTRFDAHALIAPGALLGTGALIHCFAHQTVDVPIADAMQQWRSKGNGMPYSGLMIYLPAAPLVVDMGLGLTGVKAEYNFFERAVEAGLAFTAVAGTTLIMKKVINSPRPDNTNAESFPSGHTSVAFMGAELVRLEYGWGWGAGAYALATTAAFLRSYNNRHWFSDLLAGAGVGILGAQFGRWLLEPALDALDLPWRRGSVQASVTPVVDPVSGTVCPQLAIVF